MTQKAKNNNFKSEDNATISQIQDLIQQSKYSQALTKIEKIIQQKELPPKLLLSCQLFKAQVFTRTGSFDEGLAIAQKVYEKIKEEDNELLIIDSLIIQAEALWRLNQVNESLIMIERGEQLIRVIYELNPPLWSEKKAHFLWLKGLIYSTKNRLDDSLSCYQQSLTIFVELEKKLNVAFCLNAMGGIYDKKGELHLALKQFQECLKICDEIDNTRGKALSLSNIGVIYRKLGELSLALDYCKQDLALKQELQEEREIAYSHCNLGAIYSLQGELELALEHTQKSLKIREKIDDVRNLGYTLRCIGEIYHKMGDYKKALKFFERSLEKNREIKDELKISRALYNLIILQIEQNKLEKARNYFEELTKIDEKHSNQIIHQRVRLAEANLLRTSNRAIKKAKAQEIFQEIAEEKIVDHELTIFAMQNLCELLLEELRNTGNEEVLEEVRTYVGRLIKIAKEQNSYSLLSLSYLLEAKLALLEFDIRKAQELLTESQQIADEKGLQKIAIKISNEHDALLNQMKKWQELIDKDASLQERIELARIEESLNRMIHKTAEEIQAKPEEAILIIVSSETGICLYSKKFYHKSKIDDQLIGGFLTAINNFGREALSTRGSIERIKHGEFTLLIKSKSRVIFCYVFKGQSYSASQKLEEFVQDIYKSKDLWHKLNSLGTDKVLTTKEVSFIDKTIEKQFQITLINH
ncbi:MAG: tetratricopeptide repeat protein [Candidatus Heimdallarchaeota archaeon]|nr:tetratricopeptide repeat protein [Candidatus Heimdallarchaeota archaeon]